VVVVVAAAAAGVVAAMEAAVEVAAINLVGYLKLCGVCTVIKTQ
jgi:hypothetical protein